MAVEVVQLLLDVAAEAASIVPVQPLSHDAHAVLTFMLVEGKVFYLGGNASTPTRMALLLHNYWCPWRLGYVLTEVGRNAGR